MRFPSGLPVFEPKMPRSVDPLWTVGDADAGKPRQQRSVADRELDGIPTHPDRPQVGMPG